MQASTSCSTSSATSTVQLCISEPLPIVDQSWSIEDIITKCPPPTWETVFLEALKEVTSSMGPGIDDDLREEERRYGTYFPLKKDLFRAFWLTPLSKVKVCIIGQDPYPQSLADGTPRAVGMAFSVNKNDEIPVSLKNIYTEIRNSVEHFVPPDHGDLSEWAANGVLLLNSCLTIRPLMPGSHSGIWLGFISIIIKAILAKNPYTIFCLWGKEAKDTIGTMLIGTKAVVLESSHPSGYSANFGFFGCGHFKRVNEILVERGETPIDWNLTPTYIERKQKKVRLPPLRKSKALPKSSEDGEKDKVTIV